MEKTVTSRFLDSIWNFSQKSVPENIVDQAKFCLIDYIACATLGASLLNEQNENYLSSFNEVGTVSVVGTKKKTNMLSAAMLNGINSHMIELDDGHRYAMLHLGAPVISALISVAQGNQIDANHFIKGIVVGYEATIRLASAIQPGHKLKGYHATATCGTIGTAIGLAVALGIEKDYWNSIISAAATDSAGLLQVMDDGSELKPYNIGRAAAAAVNATLVGKTGLEGPEDVLGGNRGFFKTMATDVEEKYLIDGFLPSYAIELIYRKPYAACRHCHAAIEATLNICKDNEIRADDIKSIEVSTYGLAVKGHEHTEIKGSSSAKMSIPYSVAVAVVCGKVNYQQYEDECISNPKVLELAKKVMVQEDAELSKLVPEKRAAIVTIRTFSNEYSNRVDYPLGEPENPMSKDAIKEKYKSLMSAAGKEDKEITRILDCIYDIENRYDELLEIV